MKRRTAWFAVGTGLAVFVVHAGLLLLAFLFAMSGVAAHGQGAAGAAIGPKVGSVLIAVLGFPFLDLALWLRGSSLTGGMWVASGLLTSAAWAGVASTWIARRRA